MSRPPHFPCCALVIGALLALPVPVLAADVVVDLDAATGFVVKDSGAAKILRVDEATGNISRNAVLFMHTTGTDNRSSGRARGTRAAVLSPRPRSGPMHFLQTSDS